MKVVQDRNTGRLVYRQEPDFTPGLGIRNAMILGLGTPDHLQEIDTTDAKWQLEITLRRQAEPPTLQEQIDDLTAAVADLKSARKP